MQRRVVLGEFQVAELVELGVTRLLQASDTIAKIHPGEARSLACRMFMCSTGEMIAASVPHPTCMLLGRSGHGSRQFNGRQAEALQIHSILHHALTHSTEKGNQAEKHSSGNTLGVELPASLKPGFPTRRLDEGHMASGTEHGAILPLKSEGVGGLP